MAEIEAGARPAGTGVAAQDREEGFFECVKEDILHFTELKRARRRRGGVTGILDALMMPGVWSVFIFRLSRVFYRWRLRPISRCLYILNLVLFGADFWPGSSVGPGLRVPHPVGTGFAAWRIGRRVTLLGLSRIGAAARDDDERDGLPVLGNEVRVGDGARIFGPVHIGDRARIGAAVLLFKSVPDDGLVLAVPSRVISIGGRSAADERQP